MRNIPFYLRGLREGGIRAEKRPLLCRPSTYSLKLIITRWTRRRRTTPRLKHLTIKHNREFMQR
jgi:hypothetical protein